jgi:hypothetical protein
MRSSHRSPRLSLEGMEERVHPAALTVPFPARIGADVRTRIQAAVRAEEPAAEEQSPESLLEPAYEVQRDGRDVRITYDNMPDGAYAEFTRDGQARTQRMQGEGVITADEGTPVLLRMPGQKARRIDIGPRGRKIRLERLDVPPEREAEEKGERPEGAEPPEPPEVHVHAGHGHHHPAHGAHHPEGSEKEEREPDEMFRFRTDLHTHGKHASHDRGHPAHHHEEDAEETAEQHRETRDAQERLVPSDAADTAHGERVPQNDAAGEWDAGASADAVLPMASSVLGQAPVFTDGNPRLRRGRDPRDEWVW